MSALPSTARVWRPLGEILVAHSLITDDQLRDALREQEEEGGRLGEILFARGWVSAVDLKDALAEQHGLDLRVEIRRTAGSVSAGAGPEGSANYPLGWLLVQRGHISEAQLDAALSEQSQTGQRLGQILINHSAVSVLVLAAALAEQQGLVSANQHAWEAAQDSRNIYEVREIEEGNSYRLYTSLTFLDATDLAFAILNEWEPQELQVMRVDGEQDVELCWRYPPADVLQ